MINSPLLSSSLIQVRAAVGYPNCQYAAIRRKRYSLYSPALIRIHSRYWLMRPKIPQVGLAVSVADGQRVSSTGHVCKSHSSESAVVWIGERHSLRPLRHTPHLRLSGIVASGKPCAVLAERERQDAQ